MSKEQGILNKDNAEHILRNIDKSFFKGGFSKISSGSVEQVEENAPALVAMHKNRVLGRGVLRPVTDLAKVIEIVNNAETEKVATQKVLQQGGMGL